MSLSHFMRSSIHHFGNFLRFMKMSYLRKSGVKIGKNTMISLGAHIDVRRGTVVIGDNVIITNGTYVLSHDAAARYLGQISEHTTTIHDNSFIGVNSVIMSGIEIGPNSIIGAGSVVTKTIPPNCVAVGNPARIIKEDITLDMSKK